MESKKDLKCSVKCGMERASKSFTFEGFLILLILVPIMLLLLNDGLKSKETTCLCIVEIALFIEVWEFF